MRSRKAFWNMAASLALQAVIAAAGFVLPRLFISAYGSSVNGLVSSVRSFMLYLNLVETGIGASAVVSLYLPLAEHDHAAVNGALSAARAFYAKSGWVFVGLVALLAVAYPAITDRSVDAITASLMVLVIGTTSLSHYFVLGKYRVLLTADQSSYVISLNQAAATALSTAVCVLLVHWRVSVLLVQGAASAVYLLQALTLVLYCRRRYPFMDLSTAPNAKALERRWDAMIHQIGFVLTSASPIVLITVLCGLKEVSIYAVYSLVISAITLLTSSFAGGLTAGFGELAVYESPRRLEEALDSYELLFFMVLTAAYTSAAVLYLPFISAYVRGVHDADYVRGSLAVLMIAAGVSANARTPYLTMVNAVGRFRETRVGALVEPGLLIAAGAVLGGLWGTPGVLCAMAASSLIRSVDLALFAVRRIARHPARRTLKRIGLSALSAVLAAVPFITGAAAIRTTGLIDCAVRAVPTALWVCAVVLAVNSLADRRSMELAMRRLLRVAGRPVRSTRGAQEATLNAP